MKKLFLLFCITFCSEMNMPKGDLFDKIVFSKGIAILQNVSVSFQSIGKNPFDMNMFFCKDSIRSHTALEFSYNDKIYYLPIDNNVSCDFVDTCHKGDVIYIDIVIIDSLNIIEYQKTGVKVYYSYINAIK